MNTSFAVVRRSALVLALLLAHAPGVLAIPTSWEPRGPGGGGALFQPSLSPHAPQEMHVSCDMSQLFRTDDYGQSWSMLDFRVLGGNRETRVWYTPDPSIVYTIDRATRNLVDLYRPVKSLDGGRTWGPLPGLAPDFESWDMAVDPANANRVFVVDYTALYGSQDGGQTFSPPLFVDGTGGGVRLAGIFTDGDLVLLGTNSGLLVSNDGGRSFARNPGMTGIDFTAEGMTGFAGAKNAGTGAIRLVSVTHGLFDIFLGMYACDHAGFVGVYTLDWPATAWTSSTTGLAPGDHPFFAGMSAGNTDVMWLAGGTDTSLPLIARSVDGGRTWANSLICAGNANVATGWQGDGGDRNWTYGECAMGFGVSPVDPLRAAITDYGFVHVTDDGGVTWRQAYVSPASQNPAGAPTPTRRSYPSVGLENTTAWDVHWIDPTTLIACYSDIRGTRSEDGGASWGFDYAGHTWNSMYQVVRRPSDGRIFAAVSTVHDMYQSTRLTDTNIGPGDGAVLFSDDGGSTWQLMRDFNEPVVWVALHPNEPETLFASVVDTLNGDVYATYDASAGPAATWTRLGTPDRTQGRPFNVHVLNDGEIVASYSGRRASNQFTASSGVFVSPALENGRRWLDRSDPAMQYWTKDVVIDPHDPLQRIFYACVYSGWGGSTPGTGGLYRTDDRGMSWTRILNVDRVGSITISPIDPDEAYVSTEADGLWTTSNLRSATPTFTQDPNYPFRHPERVRYNPSDPGEIWVTSFGNGLRVGQDGVVPIPRNMRRVTLTARALDSPPLATILPMDASDIILPDAVSGDLDPDLAIVGDPTRPVAFYDIDANIVIQLRRTPANRIQINW